MMFDPEILWPWVRLVTALGAVISVTIAILTYIRNSREARNSRQSSEQRERTLNRSKFWREVNKLASIINSIELDLDPAGSRKNDLFISKFDDNNRSERYANMFYQQVNLLHLAHLYKDFLEESEREKFDDWAKYTLNCWIEKVEPIQIVLEDVLAGTEFYGDEFIAYLRTVLSRPFRDKSGGFAKKDRDLISHRVG